MTPGSRLRALWEQACAEAILRDKDEINLMSSDDLLDAAIVELLLLIDELDRLRADVAEERRANALLLAAELIRRAKVDA